MSDRRNAILIPGGCSDLADGLLQKLSNSEFDCIVIDRDSDRLEICRKKFPQFRFILFDLADGLGLMKLLEDIFLEFKVVAVINMIGWIFNRPLIKFDAGKMDCHSLEDWNKVLTLNLSIPFYLTTLSASHMIAQRTKGVIVNVSSISAQGNAGQTAYSSAKAGLEAFTLSAAKELGPLGVRCVCVAPGFMETPSTHQALNADSIAKLKGATPLRRMGSTLEFASAVTWIMENKFFTGKVLALDGGLVL